jgi:hypothetical protein
MAQLLKAVTAAAVYFGQMVIIMQVVVVAQCIVMQFLLHV